LTQLKELVTKQTESLDGLRSKMDTTLTQFREVRAESTSFRANFESVERQLKDVRYLLSRKADLEKVKDTMENYCSYGNLKDVYDRCVPPVQAAME
jgi:uncharacterized coiled-coil DUF342 family protein